MGYYAKTRIDAGRDKDGKPRTFDVGQEVTGLDDAQIKQLQDAGSLTEQAPREGEPGYQAAPNADATRIQQEREQAQRDAATSGVGGPSSQRGTSNNEAQQRERDRDQAQRDRTAQTSTAEATSQPLSSSTAATGREPPGPDTSTKQRR